MSKYSFHDVARSERYFTATLLSHLLMANNFEGSKALFKYILNNKDLDEVDDFEVVTELDPIRDASVLGNKEKELYKTNGRVAVPDIFLRWGKYVLIIEAKFFTSPSWDALRYQVNEQKRAVELIIDNTEYKHNNLTYLLLLINKPLGAKEGEISIITWEEIINLIEKCNSSTADLKYSIQIIKQAIERAKNELRVGSNVSFQIINNINELINKLPKLLNEGKIYVGFSEPNSVDHYDLNYFEKRGHYKVSDIQHSRNWIRIEELLKRYVSLKHK